MSIGQRRLVVAISATLTLVLVGVVAGRFLGRRQRARAGVSTKQPAAPSRPLTRFEALPRVVARVGDVEVTKDALRAVLEDGNPASPQDVSTPGDDDYALDLYLATKAEVLNRVLTAEAHRRGITLTSEELAEIQLKPDVRAQLDEVAPQAGLTGEELVRRREEMRLVEKLVMTEVYDKVEVSEDEIVAEFERETSGYVKGAGYRVRRILLGSRFAAGQDDAEVLARAAKLAEELRAKGANFAAAAKKLSESDEGEGKKGGLMPDFTLDQPPTRDGDFLAAIRSLQPGQVSPPIRASGGYQILELEQLLPPTRMTLSEARPMITKKLRYTKGAPLALRWAEEQEQKAGAVILVPMPAEVAQGRQRILGGAKP